MHRTGLSIFMIVLAAVPALGQSEGTIQDRLTQAATVLRELAAAPDSDIPKDLLEDASCVAVIPGIRRVAFGFGGRYGRGLAVCRIGATGDWSAPAMIALDGGSFGFQLGVTSIDAVMLFMTDNSVRHLLGGEVTLGGNVNASAGPKGRNVSAETNLDFRAEILTYGRSRGLFAGVSLEGASLRPDRDANQVLYGREIGPESILRDAAVATPPAASGLRAALSELNN